VLYAIAFGLVNLALLAPLSAGTLRLFLEQHGRASVGNFEIASFLLSPAGLAAMTLGGALWLATLYLELAGLMRLMADPSLPWWRALAGMGLRLPHLLHLGARQLVIYVGLAALFAAAIAMSLNALWRGRDLYVLLALKPPQFWVGVALAGAIVLAYLLIAGHLFVRWVFALPAALFETDDGAGAAIASSARRTRGQRVWLGLVLLAAAMLWLALDLAVLSLLRHASAAALDRVGGSLPAILVATALVVGASGLVVSVVGLIGQVGLAGLVLGLYRECGGRVEPDHASALETPPARTLRARGPVLMGGLSVLAFGTVAASHVAVDDLSVGTEVEITAHRGGWAVAPENTVAAIRSAVAAHADWAEIDVMHTADEQLAVLHDTDLARLGGGPRQVRQTSLAELQALDVGRMFGAAFAGERIPTLEAVLDASAAGGIGLNIELKPQGRDDVEPLVRHVVEAVRPRLAAGQRIRLCSQSYDGMRLAKRLLPEVEVGFIAGAALGDLSRLDIDFLMVNNRMATRPLIERARAHGMPVHAWSISNPDLVPGLVDRGVANIITGDPARIRTRLEQVQALDPVGRLLLRVRDELGVAIQAPSDRD
jgi:glycerophosphoryl diester phosphodiesterase